MLFKRIIGLRHSSSLIPPPIASIKELGKLKSTHSMSHPQVFAKMKHFYTHVPKGPAPKSIPTTFVGKYYEKYHEKDSFMPVVHFILAVMGVGYYLTYFKGGHCILFY